MKIFDFIKSKQITSEEIENNFEIYKKIVIKSKENPICYNCNKFLDKKLPTDSSWFSVKYYYECDSINIIYYDDEMNGRSPYVTIYIYKGSKND